MQTVYRRYIYYINVRAYARVYTKYNENNSLQRYSTEYPCRLFRALFKGKKGLSRKEMGKFP